MLKRWQTGRQHVDSARRNGGAHLSAALGILSLNGTTKVPVYSRSLRTSSVVPNVRSGPAETTRTFCVEDGLGQPPKALLDDLRGLVAHSGAGKRVW